VKKWKKAQYDIYSVLSNGSHQLLRKEEYNDKFVISCSNESNEMAEKEEYIRIIMK
jgi:hypothetical protein